MRESYDTFRHTTINKENCDRNYRNTHSLFYTLYGIAYNAENFIEAAGSGDSTDKKLMLMKMEPQIAKRIVKNVLVSLLIYVLPIALMFLTFYFSGQRPWEKKIEQKNGITK